MQALKSIGACLAGALTGIVFSIATDLGLHAASLFPALGEPMSNPLLLLALTYRTLYGIAGSYLTARLAPSRPMLHSLVLGFIGLVVNVAGVVSTWNAGPAYEAHWYPLALTALALPTAWVGAKLRLVQLAAK